MRAVSSALQAKWRSQSPKRETADSTMYELGKQDGMCEGVELYLQEMERLASER